MRIPAALELLSNDNDDEVLDVFSEMDGLELLALQAVADRITMLVATEFYAREIMATQNDNSSSQV
jgi:hypothetical protein